MLLSDINPYIRYAAKATLNKKPGLYKAIDHHMFFINDGEEKIVIIGVCRQLKKNNFFIIPANTPYEFILRKPILFTSINYDYTQQRRHKTEPVFPVTADTVLDDDILNEKFSDNDILNNPIFITDGQFAAADPASHHDSTGSGRLILCTIDNCSALSHRIICRIYRCPWIFPGRLICARCFRSSGLRCLSWCRCCCDWRQRSLSRCRYFCGWCHRRLPWCRCGRNRRS